MEQANVDYKQVKIIEEKGENKSAAGCEHHYLPQIFLSDQYQVLGMACLHGQSVVFISESCERCEYVYLKWKQEMSYSCAENVAQLSRTRDGLSILQECRKKKKKKKSGLTHEG